MHGSFGMSLTGHVGAIEPPHPAHIATARTADGADAFIVLSLSFTIEAHVSAFNSEAVREPYAEPSALHGRLVQGDPIRGLTAGIGNERSRADEFQACGGLEP